MRRILITGSQGFVGSYICAELLEHGYKVIGVDNYSKYGEITRAHDTNPNFTFCYCDVSKGSSFNDIVKFYRPQAIISLAAKVGEEKPSGLPAIPPKPKGEVPAPCKGKDWLGTRGA